MPLFTVMRRGDPPVTIEAANWIVAMGNGIQALGGETAIDRLACEMLPNGTVIARDVRSGIGYVVQPRSQPPEEPSTAEERSLEQTMDEVLERTMSEQDPVVSPAPEALAAVLDRIRDATGIASAWDTTLDAALDAVPCEAGAAVEATRSDGLLFVSVRGSMATKLHAMRLPYGKGYVGFCVDKGAALAAHDVDQDPRHYAGVDQATGFTTRAVLCVPVVRDDRCYGCLELLNPERRFRRGDLIRVEQLAEALAGRLYRAGRRGRPLSG